MMKLEQNIFDSIGIFATKVKSIVMYVCEVRAIINEKNHIKIFSVDRLFI